MSIFLMILIIPYLIPGLMLARGMYAEQIRAIRSGTKNNSIPPEPPRPRIKLSEVLHDTAGRGRCQRHLSTRYSCNCSSREEWINIRNAWIDYDDWQSNWAYKKPKADSVNMTPIYISTVFWPIAIMGMYIKGGAKNIPDFREIERLEQSAGIKELT